MKIPLSISEAQLDAAYKWLCQQRKHYPPNADIWDFRFHWEENKFKLLAEVNSGNYLFSPLKCICKKNGQLLHIWSSQDALILKVLAQFLSNTLTTSRSCTHIKGNGGLKQTVKNTDTICKVLSLHATRSKKTLNVFIGFMSNR